jgi:hypothetical protein
MMQQSRRQLLIRAVRDAAIELAAKANRARYASALLDYKKPTPDEISAAAAARESATGGTYLDNTDKDELWVAYAINTVSSGRRYAGLGRTAAETKADAWINSHWSGGTTSALVQVFNQGSRRLDFRALSAAKAETGDARYQRSRHF